MIVGVGLKIIVIRFAGVFWVCHWNFKRIDYFGVR